MDLRVTRNQPLPHFRREGWDRDKMRNE